METPARPFLPAGCPAANGIGGFPNHAKHIGAGKL